MKIKRRFFREKLPHYSFSPKFEKYTTQKYIENKHKNYLFIITRIMGNGVSKIKNIEKEDCISQIMNYNCRILDIGNKVGKMGYIDFINPKDIEKDVNVIKGRDICDRFFIVVKCEYLYKDGTTEKTFSTFFQRHTGDKNLWHCCGIYDNILMDTEGGMNIEQFTLLSNLLKNKRIELNYDVVKNTYLTCFNGGLPIYPYHSAYPIALQLGYSNENNQKPNNETNHQ